MHKVTQPSEVIVVTESALCRAFYCAVCLHVCLSVCVRRDGHGLGPSVGWVGLNEKYLLLFCSLHFVFVVILCAKKICK